MLKHRKKQTKKTLRDMELLADPHKLNYAAFNNVNVSEVTKEQRQDAKGIVFGTMYGMAETSLGNSINKTPEEAAKVQRRFFNTYKDAEKWLIGVERQAERNLYVSTPIGRRRNMPGYLIPDGRVKKALNRRARNSPIQGIASDFTIMAADIYHRKLTECMKILTKKGLARKPESKPMPEKGKCDLEYLPYGLNSMVHDSLKGESYFDYFFLHLRLIEWSMTDGLRDFLQKTYSLEIKTPFSIEIEIGSDWSRKEKWDWRSKTLDDIVLKSLENHKEIYPNHPEVGKINPNKTLKRMKRCYEQQRAVLSI